MRDDIRRLVDMLKAGIETALRSANDEEYVEAMEELSEHCSDASRARAGIRHEEEG